MTPEEIIEQIQIQIQNRHLIDNVGGNGVLTLERALELMNVGAMQGFRWGGESALSMIKGTLVLQYAATASQAAGAAR